VANAIYDRTLAFAGLCQAVTLVQQIAKNGHCDPDAFATSLKAITCTNPSNTLAVFGHEHQLKLGLACLVKGIDSTPAGSEITRYLISLMALERKLSGRRDTMNQLGDRIQMIERQLEHFDLFDDQMISNLASIYLDVISPIGTSSSPDFWSQKNDRTGADFVSANLSDDPLFELLTPLTHYSGEEHGTVSIDCCFTGRWPLRK